MAVFANLRRIPNVLSARSPRGLRRLMLNNNVKHGIEFKYFDIQFINGRWFAWFYLVDTPQPVVEVTNGSE